MQVAGLRGKLRLRYALRGSICHVQTKAFSFLNPVPLQAVPGFRLRYFEVGAARIVPPSKNAALASTLFQSARRRHASDKVFAMTPRSMHLSTSAPSMVRKI